MKPTPQQVDDGIASRIEQLKARATTPPTEEPVDEEAVRREEEERRAAQRADTLRRMAKSSVLVQRTDSGALKFVHDIQMREGRTSR
jgi:hypothetical protein